MKIGFAGLLTLLFVGLKLTGYIDWSWWWVLAPTWIMFVALFVLVTLAMVVSVMDDTPSWMKQRAYA